MLADAAAAALLAQREPAAVFADDVPDHCCFSSWLAFDHSRSISRYLD
jgi:hypothetical protein